MKKLFFVLTIVITLATISFGQKKSDAQVLMDIEKAIIDGVTGGKLAEITKYYSPDYAITTPEGAVLSFKDLVDSFKSGDLKIESSVNSEMTTKIYGNTAIVRYKSTDKGTFKGNPIAAKNQWTDVFMKVKGKWLVISSHGTPILPM